MSILSEINNFPNIILRIFVCFVFNVVFSLIFEIYSLGLLIEKKSIEFILHFGENKIFSCECDKLYD